VASQLGVSAGAIRLWESQGLIRVRRDERGHRDITDQDIERLRRICWWRRVGKINHHAIRRLLAGDDGDDRHDLTRSQDPDAPLALTGARLRVMRLSLGLTLGQLAEMTGLSVSFISSFERGINMASPTSLARLSAAIEGHAVDADAEGHTVYQLGSSAGVEVAPGIRYEWLSPRKGMMEPQLVTVEPGRGSEGSYQHAGEEFVAVLTGELMFTVQGEQLHMPEGGTLHFDSQFEHAWHNPGDTAARVLWLTTERGVWRADAEQAKTPKARETHARMHGGAPPTTATPPTTEGSAG
jgi:DNA-binding transcriptional MerR regulator/quercetin dioxygenase-like cupin family protein